MTVKFHKSVINAWSHTWPLLDQLDEVPQWVAQDVIDIAHRSILRINSEIVYKRIIHLRDRLEDHLLKEGSEKPEFKQMMKDIHRLLPAPKKKVYKKLGIEVARDDNGKPVLIFKKGKRSKKK